MTLLLLCVAALAAPAADRAAFRADARAASVGDSPGARLEFAVALAARPDTAEEARDALLALLPVPEVSSAARQALVRLCIREAARPGWLGTYARLGADPRVSRLDADTLALRDAQARTWVRPSNARARDALAARFARSPEDEELRFYLARALMVAGEPARALVLFEGGARIDERLGAEMRLGARVARLALASGDLGERARAITAGGYPDLAVSVVRREDPRRADPDAWAVIGELQMARGRVAEAIEDYRLALVRTPSDGELRVGLVRAYLAAGRAAEATTIAAGAGDAQRVLDAHASPTASYELAPDEPDVIRARARQLAESGDPETAFKLLESLPLSTEAGRLALFTSVGLAAGQEERVLEAWRLALVRAGGGKARERLTIAMADVYGQVAEARKARGAGAGAADAYRIALAMAPDRPGPLAGLGGVLWQEGQLSAARDAFTRAASLDPLDPGPLVAAVELSLQMGEPDRALALLRSPQLGPDARLVPLVRRAEAALVIAALPTTLRDGGPDRVATLLAVLHAHRDDASVVTAVARHLLMEGHAADALEAWRTAARLTPADPWVRVGIARSLTALGSFADAAAELTSATTLAGPPVANGALEKEVAAARGELLRAEGDRLWRDEHRDRAAFDKYAEALALSQDTWTLSALAGLYLSHGQAEPAHGFFRAAVQADPANRLAWKGTIRALEALGEPPRALLAEAGVADADGALRREVEGAERRAAVASAERRAGRGQVAAARRDLDALALAWPSSPEVLVAAGGMALREGDAAAGLERAAEALRLDGAHPGALRLCLDAGRAGGNLERAAALIVDAQRRATAGSGEQAAGFVRQAKFVAQVDAAVDAARRGRPFDARRRMSGLEEEAASNADLLVLMADGWASMGAVRRARTAYGRALTLDPRSSDAALGLAFLELEQGRSAVARALLKSRFDQTNDAAIGMALARVEARSGASGRARSTLATVRRGGTKREALPVLAVPGAVPTPEAASTRGRARLERADAIATLGGAAPVGGAAFGGVISRAGDEGFGALRVQMAGAGWRQGFIGPFDAEISAVGLALQDGVRSADGVSAAAGVATPPGRRVGAEARVGTTVLDFEARPSASWLGEVSWHATPHLELLAETGRAPVTDSLASWAGATGEFGSYGAVSSTWLGGKVVIRTPLLLDAGAEARFASLRAPDMEPVERREYAAWAGKRFGPPERSLRLGLAASAMTHDREIDAFEPGQGGVFSPLSFRTGQLVVDGRWRFGSAGTGGTRLCGGVGAGVQDVESGSATFVGAGVHPAVAARLGAATHISPHWDAGVSLRADVVTQGWSQQSGVGWVTWRADAASEANGALPEIHGAAVAGTMGCP